jgi:uncharacterized membrane protein YgcG
VSIKATFWCIVITLVSLSSPASAAYFTIKDYGVDIKVHGKEGYFEVKETLVISYTQPRHGINHKLIYKYKKDGEIKEFKIYDVSVEGHPYEVSKSGNYNVVKIGSASRFVEGIQTYVIHYKVKKAWIFTQTHSEFYWDIIGHEWKAPIDRIHYTITLDEFLPMSESDYYIYTGYQGVKGQDVSIAYNAGVFSGSSTRPFDEREGVTIAIKLPKEYVLRPTKAEIWWEKHGFMTIGGSIFGLIASMFFWVWRRYGKDYTIVRMVQFDPPKDITPAEAGVIIDEKADNIDIIALIPYWAHKGYMNIKKINGDHELIKIKDLGSDAPAHERIVFSKLFSYGDTVRLSSLEYEFSATMNAAKSSLQSSVNGSGIYYPISMKAQIISYIASGLLIILGFGALVLFGSVWICAGLVGAGLIGFFFSYHMLKRSEKGVHLYQHILGFKMFVKEAEKDKLEYMLKEDPDYFEKTLPYAMIFGYAKQWSAKFDGLLLEPPNWYIGGGHMYHGGYFNTGDFGRTFEDSVQEIESVFSSVPEPSSNFGGGSGGGFSGGGGGFSGGGFGGGGGDSW